MRIPGRETGLRGGGALPTGWPWLVAILVLATAIRVWMTYALEVTVQDVVPITESYCLFAYHDPFSLLWGSLSRLLVDSPPLWWFRIPSLVASVVTVVSVSRFTVRRHGTTAGVLAGLILSVSFPLVVSSAFVRGYSIHVLGAWLIITAVDRLMNEGGGARRLVVGTLLCAAHQWVVLFLAMWISLLGIWVIARARTEQGSILLRRLRNPAFIRASVASVLIVAWLGIAWFSGQFIMGVKEAYQQGSPDIFDSVLTATEMALFLVSRPLFALASGSHWLAIILYSLAAWGLFVSARTLRDGIVTTAAAFLAYLLIPLLVDMTFGTVGFQVGHWGFLTIPLAIWVSVGAVNLFPPGWAAGKGRVPVLFIGIVAAFSVSILPNLVSVSKYSDRGYHLVLEHSWTDIGRGVEEALAPADNLVFVESEHLFLTSHLFAYTFGDDEHDITLLSEDLPGSALFRRFLLHDLWQVPGRHLPLHRWMDFDGLKKAATHWTGRVIVVLPNPEHGAYLEWFDREGPYLPRRCAGRPGFPQGIHWSGGENGWIALFDVEREPVDRVIARILLLLDAYTGVCFERSIP